ncbi:pyridoxamine 5'-phosphate oxidase family protein [Streptomyces sp. MB09-02B]|uniref:pyridoxamine 5'-phosphate oxidase family protein n=1 Tax=Streptomyces sp. MB09-02B TaxID=3028667 RepID=UPI0029A7EF93|nr:pyridoxamine 5'-phosphate oxidase family protein [Streptomyces sp. MB09-02B]MDX3643676.1 pyridoxamine 5'-phosphate oxidase family protein [Streptomyces sp. MB09-02B]
MERGQARVDVGDVAAPGGGDPAGRGALPAAVRDRLAVERNVWLCTVRPDGSPHVTPVWFVFLRGSWWIGADRGSVKVRNIERRARVSLALEDGRCPVVAEGTATVHHGPFPPDEEDDRGDTDETDDRGDTDVADIAGVTEAFATKYGWDVTAPHRQGDTRVLLEVPVRRWLLAGRAQ